MKRKKFTKEQMQLQKILEDMGFETMLEYAIGDYRLDIFLPEFNLGIEYDGPMHGMSRKRDTERDQNIFLNTGIRIMRVKQITNNIKSAIVDFIEGKEID